MIKEKIIFGVHSVLEAFESAIDIDKIYVKKGGVGTELQRIKDLAKECDIPLFQVPVERLNRFTRKAHQGVVAIGCPISYTHLDLLMPKLYEEGKVPLLVIADGITDVRNFGAIARSAECAGADAIIIPMKESVSVTADAVNASAGALLRIPIVRERNIVATCRYLKDYGLNIVGASEKADTPYYKCDLSKPLAIVMGSEHSGISTPVMKELTRSIVIPQFGSIGSLNVSVAAGIILFESLKQRTN